MGVADGYECWLQLVGEFTVFRGGRRAPAAQIGSRKARTVLALLAVERGRLVTADRIVEAVWPGAPPRRPAENVATLVSRLRSALGPEAVAGGRGGYRLGPRCGVDLSEAGAMVTEAEARLAGGEPTLALVTAGRAVQLLGDGLVLADLPEASWAEPARIRHADLLRRARHVVGSAALRTGDPQLARFTSEAAIATDPYDEIACRTLMRALVAAGEPARALAAYQRLRGTLADELGADPAPATRDLHVGILRSRVEQPPALAATTREPGFVGRERELDRLAGAWEAVAAGGGRRLLVTGEAGIGKTRLVEQVVRLAGATGGAVVHARCHRVDRPLPLHPILDGLTRLVAGMPVTTLREAAGDRARALAGLLPELGTALGVAAADLGCAEAHQHRCQDALVVFLHRLSARRPVLLALDDAHDADPATLRLLHALVRDATDARVLVVATVRSEAEEPVLAALGASERLPLGPLAAAELAQLAHAAGQPERVAPLVRRTGGHPLLAVALLRAVGGDGLPESARAAILDRVRRAGPPAADLLRAAAVLGSRFTPARLAGLLDLAEPELARRCERIAATGLTVLAGEGYAFANEIVREVLYESTPAPTRAAYQRLTARPVRRERLRHRVRATGRLLSGAQPLATE